MPGVEANAVSFLSGNSVSGWQGTGFLSYRQAESHARGGTGMEGWPPSKGKLGFSCRTSTLAGWGLGARACHTA